MLDPSLVQKFKDIVGEQYVLTSDMERTLYSYDAYLVPSLPDIVVLPANTDEVSRAVKLAHENGLPVTSRGAGTSLTGGPVPLKGGLVLHFSRMNHILDIDVANRTTTVEPGVVTLDLQNAVAAKGLQYAPDPASQKTSTPGGQCGRKRRRPPLPEIRGDHQPCAGPGGSAL